MRKRIIVTIAVLVALTTLTAVWHRKTQESVSCMVISYDGKEKTVSFEDMDQTDFSGNLINGKGEITGNHYRGILLKDLLDAQQIDLSDAVEVKITSADNFTATYTMGEIKAPGMLYLAIEKDGIPIVGVDGQSKGVQAIVFGDPNSRRCVRYATKIEIISHS